MLSRKRTRSQPGCSAAVLAVLNKRRAVDLTAHRVSYLYDVWRYEIQSHLTVADRVCLSRTCTWFYARDGHIRDIPAAFATARFSSLHWSVPFSRLLRVISYTVSLSKLGPLSCSSPHEDGRVPWLSNGDTRINWIRPFRWLRHDNDNDLSGCYLALSLSTTGTAWLSGPFDEGPRLSSTLYYSLNPGHNCVDRALLTDVLTHRSTPAQAIYATGRRWDDLSPAEQAELDTLYSL